MKVKKIYICLEGVLADFDGRVKELWGITSPDQDCTIDDYYRFWEKIRNESHFYESLTPLPGSLEMFADLYEKYKSICEIVSEQHFTYNVKHQEFVFAEGENELADKTAWAHKFLPDSVKSNWRFTGIDCEDAGYILIDSREEKITEWQNKGGTGIVFKSPQEALKELAEIEEVFCRANKKMSADKLKELVLECKEEVIKIESRYKRGLLTGDDARNEKIQIAWNAWGSIKKFCDKEEIDFDDEKDNVYQTLFASVGITIKKVPVRYYPTVELMTGSLYYFYGLENDEILFNDSDPIGKTFKFKKTIKIGEEDILLDYFFKVKKEDFEFEGKGASWEGWKCFSGSGKLEGYQWAGASINVREYNGEIQSVAIQKIYLRSTEPIWKRHSACPVDGYQWIGIYEDIPDNLEITEGKYYSDATLEPPHGRHYREHGILAYDDTEEIVILGVKDSDAEIVEIPREINGKPVPVLDERCFANCSDTLKKVILPDTLKEIGDYAFEHCENLEKPVIPASVTKIGKGIV